MMEKIQSEMLWHYYFSFNSADICALAWAMLANVCLIGVLWTWPRSFLRPQPRHLLMKALCWWFFNGTGRISHLWWGSVWRLIADLGSPLCRRRGISSAATRTVRSCQLFVKHGWKIRAAFLFFFAESAADTQACRGLGRWGELRGVRLVAGPFDQLLEEAEVSSCGGHIPCVLLKSISLSTLVQQEDTDKTARSLVQWKLLILSLQKKNMQLAPQLWNFEFQLIISVSPVQELDCFCPTLYWLWYFWRQSLRKDMEHYLPCIRDGTVKVWEWACSAV